MQDISILLKMLFYVPDSSANWIKVNNKQSLCWTLVCHCPRAIAESWSTFTLIHKCKIVKRIHPWKSRNLDSNTNHLCDNIKLIKWTSRNNMLVKSVRNLTTTYPWPLNRKLAFAISKRQAIQTSNSIFSITLVIKVDKSKTFNTNKKKDVLASKVRLIISTGITQQETIIIFFVLFIFQYIHTRIEEYNTWS